MEQKFTFVQNPPPVAAVTTTEFNAVQAQVPALFIALLNNQNEMCKAMTELNNMILKVDMKVDASRVGAKGSNTMMHARGGGSKNELDSLLQMAHNYPTWGGGKRSASDITGGGNIDVDNKHIRHLEDRLKKIAKSVELILQKDDK